MLRQLINKWRLQDFFSIKSSLADLRLQCDNGNEIVFCGLGGSGSERMTEFSSGSGFNLGIETDVEKIKSITFASGILQAIWVEEANEISESAFEQLNLRLRGHVDKNVDSQPSIVIKHYEDEDNVSSTSEANAKKSF